MQNKGIAHILDIVPFSPAGKSLFSKKTLSLPQANMVLMLDGSTAESGGVVDNHGFHLCVITDLLAMLGPCHQMP